MMHLESIWREKGRRVGLAFVREQGLELEIWDRRPRPFWSGGVLCTDHGDPAPAEGMGVPKASCWLIVLPTYLCTTRYTRLPASHPQEIAAMLEFELPRLVPCGTRRWTWDYAIVDRKEDGASEVLVFLSPLSVVEAALRQAHAVGIEPRLVTIDAALHALALAHPQGRGEPDLCGYVWWDYGSMDFLLMKGRRLAFLRGARIRGSNSQGLDAAELEVGRSLALLREHEAWPAALPLHVGGTNPEVPHLVERLGRTAGVQVCDGTARESAGAGPRTAGAVRPGYWRAGNALVAGVNLLPQHLKEKNDRARQRQQTMRHGLRTCLVILLMLVCLRASLWRTTQVLHQYEQRLSEIAPLAQKLQFLQGQLQMIQTQVHGSVSMLDIIGQLYQILPQDVTLHYLGIDQTGQVVIRAQAKRLSQAFDCIDPLERSHYLANVRQNYAHLREMEGQVLIDFELRADLEKPMRKETGV